MSDFREIVEEDQFKEDKKKLKKHSPKRLDEVLDGVTWVLARRPESFSQIPGTDVYMAKTDPFGIPALYIWFTFDEDHVYLESIEEAPIPK
jgi:hypothetical protein